MLRKKQYIIYTIVTFLIIIWVFALGGLYSVIINNDKHSCENNNTDVKYNSGIESYYSAFLSYEGKQSGAQVKALLNRLFANANTYRDEPLKIPCISFNSSLNRTNSSTEIKAACGVTEEGEIGEYVEYISLIQKNIDLKHQYNVVILVNNDNSALAITINYNEDDQFSNFTFAKEDDVNIINGFKIVSEVLDQTGSNDPDNLKDIDKKVEENND